METKTDQILAVDYPQITTKTGITYNKKVWKYIAQINSHFFQHVPFIINNEQNYGLTQ